MHTLSRKVLTLAALALFSAPAFTAPAFAAPAEAGAQSGIPSGRYTLLLTGALVGPNFASRKTTTIGVVVFDANGNYTGHIDTNETRGTFQNVTITGTYARQANGVGSLSWNAQGFGQFQFQLFTSQTSGSVESATLIETDNAAGIVGYMKRQTIPASIDGSYHADLKGETDVGSGVPDAVAVAGTLTIAKGIVQGTETVFIGNAAAGTATVLPSVSYPGTVTAPDGNGRFVFTDIFQGAPTHFVGYSIDANSYYQMQLDPPSAAAPLLAGLAVK
jgi:hypothetical protein